MDPTVVKGTGVHRRGKLWAKFFHSLIDLLRGNLGILIGLLALCVFFTVMSPYFLTSDNIFNVLRQSAPTLYIASAMTIIIILGGIDLSVGSVIAVSGCISAGLIAFNGFPVWAAVLLGILAGSAIGVLNGLIISRTTIPAFIATLATMNIGRGIATVYTAGKPVSVNNEAYWAIGTGYLGPVPLPVVYIVVILTIFSLIMYKTKLGRHMYAVGGNRQAAEFSGIKTSRVLFLAYTISGVVASIAGIVISARMFSGQSTAGTGAEMDAIAAVVLGGTSMAGGVGRLSGTVIGAFIIGVLNNGMNLMNINSFWQYVVKGFVILIAVYVDFIKSRKTKY